MTPDLVCDQLIGVGCALKLVFSWSGNPGVGSLHRRLAAVRAICPDLGIVQAQQADRNGNVQLWGITAVQKGTVLASAQSRETGAVATAERVYQEEGR